MNMFVIIVPVLWLILVTIPLCLLDTHRIAWGLWRGARALGRAGAAVLRRDPARRLDRSAPRKEVH